MKFPMNAAYLPSGSETLARSWLVAVNGHPGYVGWQGSPDTKHSTQRPMAHITLNPERFTPTPELGGRHFGWRLETQSQGDPTAEGWLRSPDDPNVQARLAHLRAKNGLKGLEIVHYSEVERATKLFLRDGFVAVSDVLSPEQLQTMQNATAARIAEMTHARPGGIRYSFNSHSNLHRQEWADLVDLPTTTPILKSIFNSDDYWCWGAGGDFSLPGTYEYQNLVSACSISVEASLCRFWPVVAHSLFLAAPRPGPR